MKYCRLILLMLSTGSVLAGPPSVPEFVQNYLDAAGLCYMLPQGRMDPYIASYFAEQEQAEPWAVAGDFNGDGLDDWAGLLRTKSGKIDLVAIYSSDNTTSHTILTPLGQDDDGIYFGVVLEAPGIVHGFPLEDDESDLVITLENPGVHLMYFEKSSVLYYWKESTFHEFWTSD